MAPPRIYARTMQAAPPISIAEVFLAAGAMSFVSKQNGLFHRFDHFYFNNQLHAME